MVGDRLRRLEALLDRVRRRATRAHSAAANGSDAQEVPASPAAAKTADSATNLRAIATPAEPEAVIPAAAASSASAASAASSIPFTPVPPVRAPMESSVTLELLDAPLEETLDEEDLVEMSSDLLESVPPGEVTELVSADASEEPPASSKRARSPHALDDAFARAAEEEVVLEDGREVPLKTPPPESGPQEAPLPAGLAAPHAPDIDALLEADLLPPVRERAAFESVEPPFGVSSAPPVQSGPTAEQLGQTIDLEEARGPDLELALPAEGPRPTPVLPAALEELEVTIPGGQSAGSYDENLRPPPQALDELDAHRRRALESSAEAEGEATPESGAMALENSQLAASPVEQLAEPSGAREHVEATGPVLLETVERSTLEGVSVQEIVPAAPTLTRPSTFAALLDASIALGG